MNRDDHGLQLNSDSREDTGLNLSTSLQSYGRSWCYSTTSLNTMAPLSMKILVDVHTHVYLPRYAAFLRSRTHVPRIFTRTNEAGQQEERLLILDNEPSGGRPVGAQVQVTSLASSL